MKKANHSQNPSSPASSSEAPADTPLGSSCQNQTINNAAAPVSEDSLKESRTSLALRLVSEAGAQTWADEAGTAYITVPVNDHVEHYRLKSDPGSTAGLWLTRVFYQSQRQALSSSAKKDVLENLMAQATSADRIFSTGRRVARVGDRVFIDLCNPTWEIVAVTPEGWSILPASQVPVRFTRAASMMPMPRPVRGGDIDALRPFFNCDDDSFCLIVAWVLTALAGGGEYPVLVLGGEAGSAKSTATRYARDLVDPNAAPLRKTPKEERDLFIAAKNAFALTFDNLSTPPEWLPDALCALALGTGYACRALYTNDDETIFQVAAPIILNGISEQLTRSDLADRALSVTLHRIEEERTRAKDEMDAAFQAVRPRVLGAVLDVLVSALRNLPSVHLARLPRMAQTAKFMAAAEPALGWSPGTFARLSELAREAVAANVAEGDPFVQALAKLVSRGGGTWTFRGNATSLKAVLATVKPDHLLAAWPPAPNKISERLRRLGPTLRLQGWEINPDLRDGTRKNGRLILLVSPSQPSTSLFEEEGRSSESSDRPDCSNHAVFDADDGFDETVRDCPWPLPASGGQQRLTKPSDLSSEAKSAPALDFGRSGDSVGSMGETRYEGEIA